MDPLPRLEFALGCPDGDSRELDRRRRPRATVNDGSTNDGGRRRDRPGPNLFHLTSGRSAGSRSGSCLEWMSAAWEEHATEMHRLVLLGMGGYPLGEHDRVGIDGAMPYAERMHVPLIVQQGRGTSEMGRRESILCQPTHLHASLADWLQVSQLSQGTRNGYARRTDRTIEERNERFAIDRHQPNRSWRAATHSSLGCNLVANFPGSNH